MLILLVILLLLALLILMAAEADWVWMGENRSVPALPPPLPLIIPLVSPLVGPRPEPGPDLLPAAAAAVGRERECESACADIDACLPTDASDAVADAAAADWLFR